MKTYVVSWIWRVASYTSQSGQMVIRARNMTEAVQRCRDNLKAMLPPHDPLAVTTETEEVIYGIKRRLLVGALRSLTPDELQALLNEVYDAT